VRVTPRYQIKTCIDCKAHMQTHSLDHCPVRPRQPFGFADWNRFETEIPKKAICAGPHWSPSAWAWWSTAESCRARGRGRTWARLSVRHVPCYQSLSSIYFDYLEFIYFMFICCYKLLWLLCYLFIICLYYGVLQNSLFSPRRLDQMAGLEADHVGGEIWGAEIGEHVGIGLEFVQVFEAGHCALLEERQSARKGMVD